MRHDAGLAVKDAGSWGVEEGKKRRRGGQKARDSTAVQRRKRSGEKRRNMDEKKARQPGMLAWLWPYACGKRRCAKMLASMARVRARGPCIGTLERAYGVGGYAGRVGWHGLGRDWLSEEKAKRCLPAPFSLSSFLSGQLLCCSAQARRAHCAVALRVAPKAVWRKGGRPGTRGGREGGRPSVEEQSSHVLGKRPCACLHATYRTGVHRTYTVIRREHAMTWCTAHSLEAYAEAYTVHNKRSVAQSGVPSTGRVGGLGGWRWRMGGGGLEDWRIRGETG